MFENAYNFSFPTEVRFGKGVIKELPQHLDQQKLKSCLLVTDSFLRTQKFVEEIIQDLEERNIQVTLFSEISKNPVKSNVVKGASAFKENQCDSIIGLGGGASMDVARSIALAINHHEDLFYYEDAVGGDKYITEPIPYFITVPTTSGTGSEVGRSSVISDDETHQKKILFAPSLLAKKVFADPELTMSLPAHITAATGMDALTHNIEAYLSKGFRPMCDGIALEGINLVHESLVKATKNPDIESRSKMMAGALMGAVAFQKGLGVVHSTAHALSTFCDMHHGLANAIMLPYCMEFNLDISRTRMETMAKRINLSTPTAESFISYLKDLNRKLDIPTKLSEVDSSINEESIDKLSELAYADVCHQCNEKPVSLNDFKDIYRKAI